MKKLCMVKGRGGYITPISKRSVKECEPFLCSDEEAAKLLRRGFFFEVKEEDTFSSDGLLCINPTFTRSLPEDWTGKSILIIVPGGIGDALIATSVARYLKQSPCTVAVKPSEPAVPFLQLVKEVDEASHTLREDKFDVVLSLRDFLKANSQEVHDGCFYYRAFQFLRIQKPAIRLPTIVPPALARSTSSLIDPRKPTVVFHTDASADHRKWFDLNWISLLKNLGGNFNKVILGKGDFTKRFGEHAIDGSHLDVGQQVALCRSAKLMVCVDSCFLHIAGILKVPTITLLGPSRAENVARMYPTVSSIQAECPCGTVYLHHKHCQHGFSCQKSLTPDKVYRVVASHLGICKRLQPKPKAQVSSGGVADLLRQQRLLVVFPHYIKGGGEVSTLEVTRQLRNFFDLSVVSFNLQKARTHENIKDTLISEFDATILEDNLIDPKFLSSFDTVLFYGMNDALCGVLRSLPRRPTVVRTVHTSYPIEGREFATKWSTVIDKTLCVNPAICDDIKGASFIPNPVSVSKLRGERKTFFQNSKPTLGFVGRFDGNKRIAWLVKAMRDIDANLLIQGMDSDSLKKQQLIRLAYEAGSSEKLHFVDPTDDVGTVMQSCDALCLLSEEEALPMVVLEAGWLGVPVICTKVGALPHLFRKEVTFVKFTENGRDCKTSLKRIVARMRTGEFPVAGRAVQMQEKVKELCSPEVVGDEYRRILRRTFGASLSLPPIVKLSRGQGLGDVIMATALLRRVQETTDTPIAFHTSPPMGGIIQKTFPSFEVTTGKRPPREFVHIDYNNCWEKGQHVVEGMGGHLNEVGIWIPKQTSRHTGRKRTVGIFPFSNMGVGFRSKELPPEILNEFILRLQEKYTVSQLGHVDNPLLANVKDARVNSVEDLIDTTSRMKYVVATEGLANHIGYVLCKSIMVIAGGSSSPEISSYDLHHNVRTPSACRCWASISDKYIGTPCSRQPKVAPCMAALSVDFLMTEFEKYVESK